jgi:transposase-like protein
MNDAGPKADQVVVKAASQGSSLETAPLESEKPCERCPACQSEAVYRYGLTQHGSQRYICLICGRQFTKHKKRAEVLHRPLCPVCGSRMHAYRREASLVRYRCSAYPACRTYLKVPAESEPDPPAP